jgi:hypothetical protein
MLRERAVHLIRSARSSACLPSPLSDIRSLPLVTLFSLRSADRFPPSADPSFLARTTTANPSWASFSDATRIVRAAPGDGVALAPWRTRNLRFGPSLGRGTSRFRRLGCCPESGRRPGRDPAPSRDVFRRDVCVILLRRGWRISHAARLFDAHGLLEPPGARHPRKAGQHDKKTCPHEEHDAGNM